MSYGSRIKAGVACPSYDKAICEDATIETRSFDVRIRQLKEAAVSFFTARRDYYWWFLEQRRLFVEAKIMKIK